MNRKLLTAIMTTIQILLLMLAGMPAVAADGGIVSGSVYYDSNGNSQPELGEANVPNATVYVELTGAETPFVVTTDAAGYFVLTGLPRLCSDSMMIANSLRAAWASGRA